MIHKTNMTIDAYLREAGIKPVRTTRHKNFIPLKTHAKPSFSKDLDAALTSNRSGSSGKKTGLRISDYLNQAKTNAPSAFFGNSTLRNNSFHPVNLNRFFNARLPSNGNRASAISTSNGNSNNTPDTPSPDGEALINEGIKTAAAKYSLPEKLIKSVIRAESNFQVDAVSPAGAQGLMQLMPATAKELGVDDPFDARQNIDGGAGYLRQMLDRFGGNVHLALAAYNAGPGTVEKYNGNVPYKETQNYIKRVLKGVSG